MGSDRPQRRPHHQRVGLSDKVGRPAGGLLDQGGDRARCGQRAGSTRPGGVRVGGDELGAGLDQPDRRGDRLERVGPGVPQHHVVGVPIGQHVPGLVHGRGQPDLADHEGAATRPLRVQELRGGQRGGPDPILRNVQPTAEQPCSQVTPGVDRVVRHDDEVGPMRRQLGDEVIGAGNHVFLVDEHPIHVHQVRPLHGRLRGVGHAAHDSGPAAARITAAPWLDRTAGGPGAHRYDPERGCQRAGRRAAGRPRCRPTRRRHCAPCWRRSVPSPPIWTWTSRCNGSSTRRRNCRAPAMARSGCSTTRPATGGCRSSSRTASARTNANESARCPPATASSAC